jgi:hypothetical protein
MKNIIEIKERTGALTLKEFYSLSTKDYNNYILQLFAIPADERTGIDNHILKYHNVKPELVLEEYFIDF